MSMPETVTSEDVPTTPTHATSARPIGCFRGCAAVFVVLVTLVVGLLVFFYWLGGVADRDHAGRWKRGADGKLVAAEDQDDSAWGLNVKAGATRVNKSTTAVTSTTNSGNASVLAKRINVLNRSDHPVMILLGDTLVRKLGELPYVEEVEYTPCGQDPKLDGPLPDLFLTIDLANLNESRLTGRSLTGDFLLHFGSRPVKQPCTYSDSFSRPTAEINSSQTAHITAEFTGFSTESAFYGEVAQGVAEDMIKHLNDSISKINEKNGPPPPIPAEFYPEYQRPEMPKPLAEFKPECLCAGHGFLLPGYGLWKFTTTEDSGQLVQGLAESLQSEGWKGSAAESDTYVRMLRGEDVCYVFPASEPETRVGITVWEPAKQEADDEPRAREYYVEILDRMSRDEVAALLDQFIGDQDVSPRLLSLFDQFLTPEQSKRLLAALEAKPGKTAQDWLDVARLLRKARIENADDRARESLEKAWTLSHFARDPVSLQEDIRAQAKSLKCEKEFKNRQFDPDANQLEALGVVRLPKEGRIPRQTIGVDSQALFFAVGPEDNVATACITVHAPEQPKRADITCPAPFGLTFSTWRKGMRSRSTGVLYPRSNGGTEKRHLDVKGLGRYELTIKHLPPKQAKEVDQFEISVEFVPQPEKKDSPDEQPPET